jgi:hypothetical protein
MPAPLGKSAARAELTTNATAASGTIQRNIVLLRIISCGSMPCYGVTSVNESLENADLDQRSGPAILKIVPSANRGAGAIRCNGATSEGHSALNA